MAQNFNCFIYLIIILITSFLISFHLLSNNNNNNNNIIINNNNLQHQQYSIGLSQRQYNLNYNQITNTLKNFTYSFPNITTNSFKPLFDSFKFSKDTSNNYDFDTSFLTCENQSKCILPHLQLAITMKIYLCKHTSQGGVRFFYLVRDGLLLHPKVIWMENLNFDEVDYIIYLPNSSPWQKSECGNPSYASKLIVLDEFDGSLNFAPFANKEERLKHYPMDPHTKAPIWNYMFFKRSYVRREDGEFIGYPHIAKKDVFPMVYSIASAYIQNTFNQQRDREVTCTLRGSDKQQTRLRVQQWVTEYINSRKLNNSLSEELNKDSRQVVSLKYFQLMASSKIIVTVNPSYWEGDFRLWESLSSGALVFCDHLMVPHHYPLIDGKHIVFFQTNNQTDLYQKLDYYLNNPELAKTIAWRGYSHAMKYHRTSNFIDYVLTTAHTKQQLSTNKTSEILHKYSYTGQYLVWKTTTQMETIKRTKLPGVY